MLDLIQKKNALLKWLVITVTILAVLAVFWETAIIKAQNTERADAYKSSETIESEPINYLNSNIVPEAELHKLFASDGGAADLFGYGVDIEGDTLVVGAPMARGTNNIIQGAVYVYVRSGTNWVLQAKLKPTATSVNEKFGESLAISDNTIVVGAINAHGETNFSQGAVYVFVRNGSDWSLQQKIYAADGVSASRFGISVGIDSDTIVVGAPMDTVQGIQKGSAYVFTRSNETWSQQTKLSELQGEHGNQFGSNVDIDNDTAVVGSVLGYTGTIRTGVAFVYQLTGGSWSQQARLSPSDGTGEFNFGFDTAIDAETIIIGARKGHVVSGGGTGSAYIFVRNGSGWTQQQELLAGDGQPGDFFGENVDISGEVVLVGAWRDSFGTYDAAGSAYVFARAGGTWTQQAKLIASDAASADHFGSGVALSNNRFIIGSTGDDIGSNSSQGSAYFFIQSTSAPDLQAASDTGVSSTDNITSSRNLSFDIPGITTGANVELLRNGTVVNNTIATSGTITLTDLNLPPDAVFQYAVRQVINGEVSSLSEVTSITIDNTSPSVGVNQGISQADPTSASSVSFTAVFSEPVVGFMASDVSLTGSTADVSAANVVVSGTGPNYDISINNVVSDGQFVRAGTAAGSVEDLAGNFVLASNSSDNNVTVDNVRPRVTINQAADQLDPTTTLPINFTVIFSEPVIGFNPVDISLIGSSANTVGATVNITGNGAIYNVSVGNITSNGRFVRPLVRANGTQDALGNGNQVSTSTDNTVTLDNVALTVFDFDGDGKTDLSIFRPLAGEWWYQKSSNGGNYAAQFGNSSDKLMPADYTGDSKTDIAFFRPNTGEWFVLRSEDFSFYSFPFGTNGDIPFVGDFDGDNKADTGVFRPSNATWYIRKSSDGSAIIQQFGQTGDIPVVADYDGDNKADIAIYRVSNGQWWIQRSQTGTIAFQFGNSTDKPVQGDYTGDGKADVAIFRPNTGEWFVLRSEDQSFYAFPFGTTGDIPSPGDYDGDGKFDATVFRPSDSTWYSNRSTAGTLIQSFGQAGDVPVPNAFVP